NSQIKSYFVGLDCNYPGMDRKEAVYRNILAWVESLCGKQPNYNVIQERLQADFEECRKDGFPLPPIPLRAQAAND
ncbi:MAG TPA: hypothetical protein VGZ47_22020, partial [Gemmataceae bacterium]|nr:hypothetical protein [Gemmataceae bacterium]